jgi:hypothetical protein
MTLTAELASKVTAAHLGRDAYVYVRQSTLTQMREHTKSLERKYERASRAQVLGWPPQQMLVVLPSGRSRLEGKRSPGTRSEAHRTSTRPSQLRAPRPRQGSAGPVKAGVLACRGVGCPSRSSMAHPLQNV